MGPIRRLLQQCVLRRLSPSFTQLRTCCQTTSLEERIIHGQVGYSLWKYSVTQTNYSQYGLSALSMASALHNTSNMSLKGQPVYSSFCRHCSGETLSKQRTAGPVKEGKVTGKGNIAGPIEKSETDSQTAQKKRKPRWISKKSQHDGKDMLSLVAYPISEKINLTTLLKDLVPDGLYEPLALPEDVSEDVLMLRRRAKYGMGKERSEIFVFSSGEVVFWNVEKTAIDEFLSVIKPHESKPYEMSLILDEVDELRYYYSTEQPTKVFSDDVVQLRRAETDEEDDNLSLEKYTISKPIALSVKLGCQEHMMELLGERLEWYPDELREGRGPNWKKISSDYQRSIGDQLHLKHSINMSSDIIEEETDFYWPSEREELAKLYKECRLLFNIPKRLKTMQVRFDHCENILSSMKDDLQHRQGVRLELVIIYLIAAEVLLTLMIEFGDYGKYWIWSVCRRLNLCSDETQDQYLDQAGDIPKSS